MDRVSGVNFFEAGKTYNIPTRPHHAIVFPGETFPMLMTDLSLIITVENKSDGLIFGLIFPHIYEKTKPLLYGVTCQVYEMGKDSRGNIATKSRVCQRFCVKGYTNDFSHTKINLNVKILPEIVMEHPLKVYCTNGTRHRHTAKNAKKLNTFYSIWPRFVYDQYDITDILAKIKAYFAYMKIS